jgi:hypothetical protein
VRGEYLGGLFVGDALVWGVEYAIAMAKSRSWSLLRSV